MSFRPMFNLFTLIFFICVIMPQSVAAEGKMVIKPSLTPGWRYDSNYYKSEKMGRAVSTYSIKPGIIMGYESPKSNFALNGSLDFQSYEDEDEIPSGALGTDEDNYTEQILGIRTESQIFDRLLLGLDAKYMNTREPANSDTYTNIIKREKYIIKTVSPKLVYRFGEKFGINSAYTNSLIDYDKFDLEDSTENRGQFDLFYNFNTTTSFDLDYQVWSRDYDLTISDYTSNQFMLNMTRKYKYFDIAGGQFNS